MKAVYFNLKEGQDKYAFMEQSVSDPSIDRVLIICDKTYPEKANNRSGGVGDEIVIISPEIYGKMQQEKSSQLYLKQMQMGTPVAQYLINPGFILIYL